MEWYFGQGHELIQKEIVRDIRRNGVCAESIIIRRVRNLVTCRLCGGVFHCRSLNNDKYLLHSIIQFCWVLNIWVVTSRHDYETYLVRDRLRYELRLDKDIDQYNRFPVCETCAQYHLDSRFIKVLDGDGVWCGPQPLRWMRRLLSRNRWDNYLDKDAQDIIEQAHRDLRDLHGNFLQL